MCSTWSTYPKPNMTEYVTWGEGSYLIEGDSNAASLGYYCKELVHPDTFTIAVPGEIPEMAISKSAKVFERHDKTPVKKVYIQTGGNLWTWYPLNIFDMNLTEYQKAMKVLIQRYKERFFMKDIVIASLPYIDPTVRVSDMQGDDHLPKQIQQLLSKLKVVDVFKVANMALREICTQEGVIYLDIYNLMKELWKVHGKGWFSDCWWWDKVHCDKRVLTQIGAAVKGAWGV